jgi:hypothetical protein
MSLPFERDQPLLQLIYNNATASSGDSKLTRKLILSLPFSDGVLQFSEMELDFAADFHANILVPARFAFTFFCVFVV